MYQQLNKLLDSDEIDSNKLVRYLIICWQWIILYLDDDVIIVRQLNLNLLLEQEMQEKLFMQVKQRLDYYRLPTIFPYECTNLLHKILTLLDKYKLQSYNYDPSKTIGKHHSKPLNIIQSALRNQMGLIVKQSNSLHLQLITAKQKIQSLKHIITKITINKNNPNSEMGTLLHMHQQREKQLFEQLNRIKFRYNELMDIIHQDPNMQKQYIKRLYKHKKYNINKMEAIDVLKETKVNENSNQQIIRTTQLQNKIANREKEIMRLQKILQYDGLNMNKILSQFSQSDQQSKINSLQQQIQYLQEENKTMKQQVTKVRKNGGGKQALKEEVSKNHQFIKQLSEENQSLKRKIKQLQFDNQVQNKQNQRQIGKVTHKLESENTINHDKDNIIKNLQKKLQFYQKQNQSLKKQLNSCLQQLNTKEISIDQMKNTAAGDKILERYEIQNLKRKIEQNQEIIKQLVIDNKKLQSENRFLREQGSLKSEAIQNLQNIVQELRRRNLGKYEQLNDLKLMAQLKGPQLKREVNQLQIEKDHQKNLKIMAQLEFEDAKTQIQKFKSENLILIGQLNRMKGLLNESHIIQEENFRIRRQLEDIKSFLKKQQTLKLKFETLLKESEQQREQIRKQCAQIINASKNVQKTIKKSLSELQLKKVQLQQIIIMLEVKCQQKDTKLNFYQGKLLQFQERMKKLNEQIASLEDEKHLISKEKHKIDKRYEELLRQREDNKVRQIQLMNLNENQHATQVIWLKKQIKNLNEKNQKYAEAYQELSQIVNLLKREKQQLNLDKINYMKQNDHLRLRLQDLQRAIALRI